MQPTLQALLSLQQIDRKLYSVESELERLPIELQGREEELARLTEQSTQLKAQAELLRREAKEIEDYTVGMRQRQRKLETESNKQKIDAAMLASYEHEIRTLKRGISDAEDEALRKLSAAEAVMDEAGALVGKHGKEFEVFEVFRANVEKELAEAEGRRAELAKQRDSASSDGVPADAFDLYTKLLKSREGEALSELADGHCQSCFVQIPRNLGVRLAKGDLVQCPSCTRILYAI
ncbi:MAG: hypothetical protein O2816_09010 [Planctomycetota bacterium]|nr:hypothetical protein [Planctomycetota bacterium]